LAATDGFEEDEIASIDYRFVGRNWRIFKRFRGPLNMDFFEVLALWVLWVFVDVLGDLWDLVWQHLEKNQIRMGL
jgi:hypothetical protein